MDPRPPRCSPGNSSSKCGSFAKAVSAAAISNGRAARAKQNCYKRS
jgi:hypothetical protein